MKRKNILKFVSLLGIGSFVMLAAASCTSTTTPTPNPEPKPTPNPESKPDPMPNPPSGGMMGGNTNPGNGGGMDNSAQQLAAAKKELSDLLATQSSNLAKYADYTNIQNTLTAAYTTAKSTSDNTSVTLEQVKSATSTLQAAIDTAASSKTSFDEKNPELIKAYYALKETLKNEETVLSGLTDSNFATIKTNLTALYQSGKDIVTKTLDPLMGAAINLSAVSQANTNISNAVSKLETWKTNATVLATSFVKEVLVKNKLTGIDTTNNQEQPGNYSFVGYSVNVTTGSDNARPNWSFAQRKVWTSNTDILSQPQPAEGENQQSAPDVSWIYNLTGMGAKYSLTFNYYGPSTGFLYFPYKLVNSSDSDKVALEYKLNESTVKTIDFAPSQTSPVASDATRENNPSTAAPAQGSTEINSAPTLDDIKIAKVRLSDLKFGENTIEFSVPTTAEEGTSKVAPMIGNMYLTSSDSDANKNKIYDDLFGNNSVQQDNQTAVTVDLLKGYSLATNYSIFVRRFMGLQENSMTRTEPIYLVGYIGGSLDRLPRANRSKVQNFNNSPTQNNNTRTFTIYVNAPVEGNYYVSGSYLFSSSQTNTQRGLKFLIDGNNAVSITVQRQVDWNTLGAFDSSKTNNQDGNSSSVVGNIKTLRLGKGLNKIIISGGTQDGTNAPYIGNLTFKLMTTTSNSETNTPAEGTSTEHAK
ncbi:variably expressed lipoprotein and hemagglutinin (VlhA) family protein [Mycoplasmoides gallisepticum CA06_2006.052-5-2P]|uniref:FIVAR domain-containing protein n=1 Tax=Mycoplasmoides gallisepticum TaxID=2096 RepID=UPI0002778C9B|nr:FIVAR domain-containing protein [Mycoplasmoides gallisepticum]AFP77898.1 variably expressed lipoprotein and hemagglutinin (VlhA) family protein [Mycoplasmoides gallisepticum NC96_1596-4-2P]AFP78655.1 variably expressed lipoprotein and hemagglutinin (VlhA) family protein [Mycoplasmoides gallisepticum NY01_2001.047-5-1P]AFP80897.1 variably expressed lipoprotein and hemagglutinin (VlhA) family protein [Mycoplasmoides gallisepticum CA06_2006.052-5-2P]